MYPLYNLKPLLPISICCNLSRVMQHINGVYTQRYNRVNNTHGPLFKGRFKAVLVEHDDALLKQT